ncbi:helix-turn-helix transcriptional regulator [Listeria monocytogenes]|uniref:helix-turn-helix domain-containing protein n=1 Tax=Listeria monocytogenes TaxID=1639 RepID=UPI0010AF0F00|nr:helix-turn-helix transcriptional regulator [Listeria monocytogenes]EAC4638157.1 XRE family transcriptional regulator [Listeria monocytogenes]EAC9089472.1 XRE family transcriptional regulator [Listeria monocytogenes]EAD8106912.1 XRE family transcriptional regulator [Listeria monocytogenes]EAD8664762.1 XRE family transcriptional regulator [Listeria monocytogenes]EAE1261637.1 XRE family transcriptional regulator [Listeria monocytogenes]
MTTFEIIKKLCSDRGMTISQLTSELNMGENSIYRWKTQKPALEKLQQVADYFNVSIDYLLGREKETGELEAFFRLNTQDLNEEEKEQLQEELEEYMLFIKNKIKKRKDDLNG